MSEEMQKKGFENKNDLGKIQTVDQNGIDLQGLLSRINFEKRWIYRGSFTTPPCTEGVLWNIVDDVQYLKSKTLRLFLNSNFKHPRGDNRCSVCAGNNREINPLNDRTVFYVE